MSKPNEKAEHQVRSVLNWYDAHKRDLPWRYEYNDDIDPYRVWLSEIMLQQTTVATVKSYFDKFTTKWPTVHDLAAASQDEVMHEWAGLGYYSRARNLHKAAQILAYDMNGQFPRRQKELKALPGIGDYTSAAIAAIAFHEGATVLDGNIERIFSRLYAVSIPLPKAKAELKSCATPYFQSCGARVGDFAQALMDIGSRICTPKNPKCDECPALSYCKARTQGNPETYPVKPAKKQRPHKHGYAYVITRNNGDILLHRRPDKGMLASTLGFPTSEWLEDKTALQHPDSYDGLGLNITQDTIGHIFTHFSLDLQLVHISIEDDFKAFDGRNDLIWHGASSPALQGLPTLFAKVYSLYKAGV